MQGHISTHWLHHLADYVANQGRDPANVVGACLPERGEASRIRVSDWRAALERAATALDDPALGLHLGASFQLRELGVLGYVISTAPNLAEALQRLQKFERLVYQINPFQLRGDGEAAVLEWQTTLGRPGQLVDETAIAALVACARELVGETLQPRSIGFVNPEPADAAPYAAFFGCETTFNNATTTVVIPAQLLARPLAMPDPALSAILETQAESLLKQIPDSEPVLLALRQALPAAIATGEPTLERMARQLHCAPRTLQRRLEAVGLTFQQALDESRRELAEGYLASNGIPLSEIALLLGYSEQSAFNRAFKRWTESTPRQWRQNYSRS